MVADWRDRQRQALRQQLYETALDLFEKGGFEGTTVQAITEAAGVAKGTFFNHFPTKEHVVAAWYDGLTVDCLQTARERRNQGARDAVCSLFVDMAQRAAASPELLIAKTRLGSHPLLVAAEKNQDEEIDVFVKAQCADARQRGEIAGVDPDFFTGLLGDLLTGTSRAYVQSGFAFDFAETIRARVDFLFDALRPGETESGETETGETETRASKADTP